MTLDLTPHVTYNLGMNSKRITVEEKAFMLRAVRHGSGRVEPHEIAMAEDLSRRGLISLRNWPDSRSTYSTIAPRRMLGLAH